MGCFTWTDAAKEPKYDKYGDYQRSCIIGYDKYCKIVCPDNTEIEEDCYDGYGRFGGRDAYDLVVDWNRADLAETIERIIANGDNFAKQVRTISKMYGSGATEEEVTEFVKQKVEEGVYGNFMIRDWKRNIGIAIACEHNADLKYPLKITCSRKHHKYEDLRPSDSTQ